MQPSASFTGYSVSNCKQDASNEADDVEAVVTMNKMNDRLGCRTAEYICGSPASFDSYNRK